MLKPIKAIIAFLASSVTSVSDSAERIAADLDKANAVFAKKVDSASKALDSKAAKALDRTQAVVEYHSGIAKSLLATADTHDQKASDAAALLNKLKGN